MQLKVVSVFVFTLRNLFRPKVYSKNKQNTYLVVDSNNVQFSKQYFHCNMRQLRKYFQITNWIRFHLFVMKLYLHTTQLTIKWNCISFMCYTQYCDTCLHVCILLYWVRTCTNVCVPTLKEIAQKRHWLHPLGTHSPYNALRRRRYPALAIELSAHTGWTKPNFGVLKSNYMTQDALHILVKKLLALKIPDFDSVQPVRRITT